MKHQDIEKIIFPAEVINQRVQELATMINQDYAGKEVLLLGILKGSFIFLSDLSRYLNLNCKIDFMAVSSYGSETKSSGVVKIQKDLDANITKKHVIIVEDIIDGGLTMQFLLNLLETKKPESLKICSLLDKTSRRICEVKIDYCGFQIPDLFVVGYGLDYQERYRELPYIGILKPSIYENK